jgi:hypothetical protein
MSTIPQTVEEQIQKYRNGKFNLLLPTKTIQEISEFHKLQLDEVQLSIEDRDAYAQDSWKDDPQEWALSKRGLMKLAQCAGIVFDPVHSKRVDKMTDKMYVSYQSCGALQKPDGTWLPLVKEYEYDLEVVEEEIRELKTAQANKRFNDEAKKEKWIEDQVRRDMLKKRRFKVMLAETGAMNRVIRALLTIKDTYTRAELARPFVVPRIVFAPDVNDPQIRAALLQTSMRSLQDAYGPKDLLRLPDNTEDLPVRFEPREEPAREQPTEPTTATPDESLPFFSESVALIQTVKDYEKLEASGDEAALVAALEGLIDSHSGQLAISKPVAEWIPAHRRKFVEMIFKDK